MRAAILALLAVVAWAAVAHADPEADFHAAEARVGRGDLAGAVDAFVAVADRAPGSTWADDALAEAARGAEQLGQLGRAAALWRRIVAQYPDSRQARRAQARLAELVAMIGPNGEWAEVAAQHEAILRDAAAHAADPRAAMARLAALVRAHADYPRANAARMWIGDTALRLGELDDAARWYGDAAAAATDPAERWRARKAGADVLAARGDFGDAADAYRALAADAAADPAALATSVRELDKRRTRWHRELGAAASLALVVLAAIGFARRDAGSWRAAARALARPPMEVFYAAPVALALVALAWRNDGTIGRLVAAISGGGLAIAWLSGATLAIASRRGDGRLGAARAIGQAVVAALAVAALAYLVIMRSVIVELLIETWRHGHEAQ